MRAVARSSRTQYHMFDRGLGRVSGWRVVVLLQLRCVCFITAGPITRVLINKRNPLSYTCGGRRVEDMCYERRRAEACVD
jgi:hypothetical protein